MVYDLINEIADAFCNHSAVLSAFSVLDPGNLPDSVTEIAEYGKVVIYFQISKNTHCNLS
jgi:hypothetical protein